MEEKIPKRWGYLVLFLVVVAAGVVLWQRKRESPIAPRRSIPAQEPQIPRQDEKSAKRDHDAEVRRLERELASLRGALAERAAQVQELRSELEHANRALVATQRRLAEIKRESETVAPAFSRPDVAAGPRSLPAAPLKEERAARAAPQPKQPEAGGIWRRPAEPGMYETVRTTTVFEEPSRSARQVSVIRKGTTVTVVAAQGDWLEVRSKHGNPPGFIQRDDAMFLEGKN